LAADQRVKIRRADVDGIVNDLREILLTTELYRTNSRLKVEKIYHMLKVARGDKN
jgi:hypothetical protein